MFLVVFNIDGPDVAHGASRTFKFVGYCAKKHQGIKRTESVKQVC